MSAKTRIDELIYELEQQYPEALCALEYSKDYELLFAARLAAQCTDERVNKIAPVLFREYPTLAALAAADVSAIEEYIRPCGFFRSKARDISACSKKLLENFGGRVPDTMDELLTLPGVGRKTANLILGDVFKKPGSVVVDTHCIRLSGRLGLTSSKDPARIETELRKILPPEKSNDFCHRLVSHGRAVCTARKPNCSNCTLRGLCDTGRLL